MRASNTILVVSGMLLASVPTWRGGTAIQGPRPHFDVDSFELRSTDTVGAPLVHFDAQRAGQFLGLGITPAVAGTGAGTYTLLAGAGEGTCTVEVSCASAVPVYVVCSNTIAGGTDVEVEVSASTCDTLPSGRVVVEYLWQH